MALWTLRHHGGARTASLSCPVALYLSRRHQATAPPFSSSPENTGTTLTSSAASGTAAVEDMFTRRFGLSAATTQRSGELTTANLSEDAVADLFARRFRQPTASSTAALRERIWTSATVSSVTASSPTPSGAVQGSGVAPAGKAAPWAGLRVALAAMQQKGSCASQDSSTTQSTPGSESSTGPPKNSNAREKDTAANHVNPSPAASSADHRYENSYRLWMGVHDHVQHEGATLQTLHERAGELKAAQRLFFQQQMRATTRWTMLVVMPILALLSVTIFFDSALFRAEVMRQQFVSYESVLEDFKVAQSKEQEKHGASSKRKANGSKKKKDVPIE